MPVLMFVVVTQAVFSFQVFVPVYQMTQGGPLDSTKVLVYYIYQQGFRFQDMGYASALVGRGAAHHDRHQLPADALAAAADVAGSRA